jgi:hypothetical protein
MRMICAPPDRCLTPRRTRARPPAERYLWLVKRSLRDAPEQAVTAFEEAIAALTRAVYERSSQAAHVASERQTVVQLRRYVLAILHEIIET